MAFISANHITERVLIHSSTLTMADGDSVRQRIISSVFSTKLVEETYVAHIKIWEEDASDEGGKKPRYIILSSKFPVHS